MYVIIKQNNLYLEVFNLDRKFISLIGRYKNIIRYIMPQRGKFLKPQNCAGSKKLLPWESFRWNNGETSGKFISCGLSLLIKNFEQHFNFLLMKLENHLQQDSFAPGYHVSIFVVWPVWEGTGGLKAVYHFPQIHIGTYELLIHILIYLHLCMSNLDV